MARIGTLNEFGELPLEVVEKIDREKKLDEYIYELEDELEFEENKDTSGQALKKHVIQTDRAIKIRELLNDLINFKELSMSGGSGKVIGLLNSGETDYVEIDPHTERKADSSEGLFETLELRYKDLMKTRR